MYLILVILIGASVPLPSDAANGYNPYPNIPNSSGQNRPSTSFQEPSYDRQPLNDKSHSFDNELLMKLDKGNENVFISPASIKATLAMILEGARGESARQILKQLNVGSTAEARQLVRDALSGLKRRGHTTLEAGHGIFVSDEFAEDRTFSDYRKLIKDNYAAHVGRIDFSKKVEASQSINAWVAKITHDLITEVLTPDNFNQNSGLVLASALYFKGDWKYEFNPELTQPRRFEASNKPAINVNMMQITETFQYDLNSDLDAHVVELPYSDGAYSMLLIVPRTKGTNNIAALLSRTNLKNILKTMEPSEVVLHLPKFQIDYSTDLRAALDSMGIRDIFSRNANLTGISSSQRLVVDALMHRSRVDVGEKGTIAASVTTASVVPLIGSSSPVVTADHPFAFIIYNKAKELVIFEGVVNEPTQAYTSDRFGDISPVSTNVDQQRPDQQQIMPNQQQPVRPDQQPFRPDHQQNIPNQQQPVRPDQQQPTRPQQGQKVPPQYSSAVPTSGRTNPIIPMPGVRQHYPQQFNAQAQDYYGQSQDHQYDPYS